MHLIGVKKFLTRNPEKKPERRQAPEFFFPGLVYMADFVRGEIGSGLVSWGMARLRGTGTAEPGPSSEFRECMYAES